jgi:hypothetical protein
MITSDFIIRYTDALYSVTEDIAPRYDEFRDMFSSGQLKSKEWILRELVKLDAVHQRKSFAIAGAWYGTLGMMLKARFPSIKVNMIDIDPRCQQFIERMIWENKDMQAITADMYRYHYKEDFIVNTSCEHIPDIREWLSIIPLGRTVILQSNDYFEGHDHINCVKNEDDFLAQTGLTDVLYCGKLEMPMYKRFMIIGKT